MAFHVSSEKVNRNVRRLAALTGQSLTEAIDGAVLDKIRLLQPREPDPDYVNDLMALSDRIGAMLKPDTRTLDELVGYGPDGLPS